MHHIPEEIRLLNIICLAYLGEEIVHQDVVDLRNGLGFRESRNEFNRAFLCEDFIRVMDGRDEMVEEFGVFVEVEQTEF